MRNNTTGGRRTTQRRIAALLTTAVTIGAGALSLNLLGTRAAAQLAAPASQPARTTQDVVTDLQSTEQQLRGIITSEETITDPAKRQAIAPKAIPLLRKMLVDFDDLATLQPQAKDNIAQTQQQFLAFLSVMGDKDADTRLATMASSKDPQESIRGQSSQLMAAWILASKDSTAQSKVADQVATLDKAHPESTDLTILTYTLSQSAPPDVKSHLQTLLTSTMNNPVAAQIKDEVAGEQKLKDSENKPVTITGKDVDGKDFSTSAWKGKVVLVDFWATWCGPCREELPRVKKIYDTYHAKGLELLGVSNDHDLNDLKDYTKTNNMPWPELFDANAAAQQQWNPITLGFGINGIPTMFLIDKKGVLRTVEARENMEDLIPKLLAEQG